ncbi:MAG: NAD(P)H-dependent oxidoreductase subunit E [Deltaproteobacteria bacterium]|nr:NAD(P)H-dependent oxidoreductase subunit E [Deltaproteobacteria bacterium]
MSVTFSALENILERYPPSSEHLISALQDVQAKFNYIPPAAMTAVCEHLGVPVSRGWAVATFYKSFSLEPKGVHEIKVCLGTACHLKGGARLVESLERELKVERGHTTRDLRFSLDTVNCVGACALAPVVVVDEGYQANTNSRRLKKFLKNVTKE